MGGTGGQGLNLGSVEPADKGQRLDNEQVQEEDDSVGCGTLVDRDDNIDAGWSFPCAWGLGFLACPCCGISNMTR